MLYRRAFMVSVALGAVGGAHLRELPGMGGMIKAIRGWALVLCTLASLGAQEALEVELEWKKVGSDAPEGLNGFVQGNLAIDSGGNVVTVNLARGDLLTVKLDPSGQELWQATHDSGHWDDAPKILIDAEDNVYVAGSSYSELDPEGKTSLTDLLLVKYDRLGELLWSTRVDGTPMMCGGCLTFRPEGLDIDSSGDLLVAATLDQSVVILRFTSDGEHLATTALPSSLSTFVIDSGSVLLSYHVDDRTWNVARWTLDGQSTWERSFVDEGVAGPVGLCSDTEGGLFIASLIVPRWESFEMCHLNDYSMRLRRFNEDGALIFNMHYPLDNAVLQADVFVAPSGAVYLIGGAKNANSPIKECWVGYRPFLQRIDPSDGTVLSASEPLSLPGHELPDHGVPHVAFGSDGSVYALYEVDHCASPEAKECGAFRVQLLLLKYDPWLRLLWQITYGDGIHDSSFKSHLAVDSSDNVYVAGVDYYQEGVGGSLTAKYSQPGFHAAPRFLRGDAAADGIVNLTDPVFLLDHLFRSGPSPGCSSAADADDNGRLDVSDAVYTLDHLFRGGAAPPAPHAECGEDPTSDDLACEAFNPCSR